MGISIIRGDYQSAYHNSEIVMTNSRPLMKFVCGDNAASIKVVFCKGEAAFMDRQQAVRIG